MRNSLSFGCARDFQISKYLTREWSAWGEADRCDDMHCATTRDPIKDILPGRDHDNEYMMIDATIVRAYQHSAGPQKTRGASHRPIPRWIDDQEFTRWSTLWSVEDSGVGDLNAGEESLGELS